MSDDFRPATQRHVFPLPVNAYPDRLDTIGKLVSRGYDVSAACHAHGCNRHARLNLIALAARFGPDAGLDVIRPALYCADCREHGRPDRLIGFLIQPPTDAHSELPRPAESFSMARRAPSVATDGAQFVAQNTVDGLKGKKPYRQLIAYNQVDNK